MELSAEFGYTTSAGPHTHTLRIIEFISIKSSAATGEDAPGMMEGTADVPQQIADAHLS
jgi:hypothetical protein